MSDIDRADMITTLVIMTFVGALSLGQLVHHHPATCDGPPGVYTRVCDLGRYPN